MAILCLIPLSLLGSDKNISLLDFANKLSLQNNITIYIDEDLQDKKVSLFVPEQISNKDLLNLFKITVSKLKLNINIRGSSYYLSQKLKYKTNTYLYKLLYNSYDDCSKLLNQLGVKYTYLNDINSLLITSTRNEFNHVSEFLKSIDVKQNQVVLKIMVFEHSNDDLEERGFKYGSGYEDVNNEQEMSLNTILFPISSNTHKLTDINFYGALRFLNDHKILSVKQFPYIMAKNNKKFIFEAVENLPFLVTTTTTEATNTSEQNSIEYKDVGLKIQGLSLIHDDYITLELDLIIEDLINSSQLSSTPQTYKRHIQSNTNVNYNEVLLLSGLKRNKHTESDFNIPFISNIPYLGELFKYKSKNDTELNITIAIEVIKSKDFQTHKVINNISNIDINDLESDYNKKEDLPL